MKDYSNRRTLLKIEFHGRTLYYSDVDGPAHKYTTSNNGEVIVEADIVDYKGTIISNGNISSSVDAYTGNRSISNVSVTLFNEDNLHLETGNRSLEAAMASLYIVRDDMYDEDIDSIRGKIFNVSWDETKISFTIKNEEATLFYNVPPLVLEEDTFQTKSILDNAEIDRHFIFVGRFAATSYGYNTKFSRPYANRLRHKDLQAAYNYWKGARVDVIDATGEGGNPESHLFCIGEFGIVVRSNFDYVYFNPTADRYVTYTFIDDQLRAETIAQSVTPPPDIPDVTTNPYEMREPIGNTLKNVLKSNPIRLENSNFDAASGGWTLGAGWTIDSINNRLTGTGATGDAEQAISVGTKGRYRISFEVLTLTGGSLTVKYKYHNSLSQVISNTITAVGKYSFEFEFGIELDLSSFTHEYDATYAIAFDGGSFSGTIGPVRFEALSKPVFMITRRPIPENSDSVGKPMPIVYGKVEKMLALHAISSKSTRQNSFSAGDDVYIIAGHKILNRHASETLVYFGLDENAKDQRVPPGVIDFVPNPLPNSVYEIDRWNDDGFNLASGDRDKDTCPLHKLVELTTNDGEIVTGIKLRGDEYHGFIIDSDEAEDTFPSVVPFVNGYPSFPIRYGLGNSKVYVSFSGHYDQDASITGVKDALIEHPIDIVKHFFLNYTNANEEFTLNEESFAIAKARLPNWKFGAAITDIIDGDKFVKRILEQCFCGYKLVDGVVHIFTHDLLDRDQADLILESTRDFVGSMKFTRTSIDRMANDFTVRYGYDYPEDSFSRVTLRNKKNDQICRDFYSFYGVDKSMNVVELTDIYDSYTANAYADTLVNIHAKVRVMLETDLAINEYTSQLKIGKEIQIEMPEFSGNYLVLSVKTTKNKMSGSFIQLL